MESNTNKSENKEYINPIDFERLKQVNMIIRSAIPAEDLMSPEEIENRKKLINEIKSGSLKEEIMPLALSEEYKETKNSFSKLTQPTKKIKDFGFKRQDTFVDLFEDDKNDVKKEEKKEDDTTISLRIPKSVNDKLIKMVIQRSSDTGKILNKSSYLRLLIEKDFNERSKFNK